VPKGLMKQSIQVEDKSEIGKEMGLTLQQEYPKKTS